MEKKFAIALDLGATHIRAALGDKKGIIRKIKEKTEKKSEKFLIEQILRLIKEAKGNYKIEGMGIGAIGPLDIKNSRIKNTPNFPIKNVSFKKIREKIKQPVFLFNDCNAAVLGEKYFGAGKNFQNLIYITMSSGIGGGAIVNGNLLLGQDGNAVEVGHLIIDQKYNLNCACKKGQGHWEAYGSGNNIPKFFKAFIKKEKIKKPAFEHSSPGQIFNQAKQGNKIALKFVSELGKINGRAVSNLISAYNPGLITFGGAVVLNNKKIILDSLKKNVEKYLKTPKIIVTPLGEDAVLYGALSAVFFNNTLP